MIPSEYKTKIYFILLISGQISIIISDNSAYKTLDTIIINNDDTVITDGIVINVIKLLQFYRHISHIKKKKQGTCIVI